LRQVTLHLLHFCDFQIIIGGGKGQIPRRFNFYESRCAMVAFIFVEGGTVPPKVQLHGLIVACPYGIGMVM
jgi:hypothetical protein